MSAFEMLDRLGTDGGVRALLVLASNIVVSAPDANRVRDRLRALDLLVVSDIFLSETAALADVVLPTAQWAEEDGTMTNLEGRVIRRRRALPPPDGVLDDLQMLRQLADRLGRGQYFSRRPARRSSTSCGGPAPAGSPTTPASATSGSTPSRACSGRARARTTRARRGCSPTRFPTAGRPGQLPPGRAPRPAETPDADYPYVLTTGRLMAPVPERHPDPPGAGAVAVPGPARGAAAPRPGPPARHRRQRHGRAAHPPRRGGVPGQRSATRSGPTRSSCRSTGAARPAANALTDPALDPHSKMPAFKVCAVDLQPDRRTRRRPPAHRHPAPAAAHAAPIDPRPPDVNQLPPAAPDEGRPHAHAEPLPARHLPVHRRRPRQAGPARRRAELRRARTACVAQALYFRGGNTTDELITVVLMRDGVPMRYFPIGAKADVHVPLRVVEDLEGGTAVELHLAAPDGLTGTVVVDLGLVEV